MTPILYASSETDFSTLGLGVLNDAISCNVRTVLNGMFELEMTYPTTGMRYKDIAISGIIKVESEKGGTPQLFDIYEISKPLNGIITVYASHVSGRKQFIPVMPCSASNITTALQVIKTYSAEDNPFTFWTNKSTSANFSVNVPKSLGQCLGGSEGSLLDVYGGEYEFDNFTIRIWNRRGQDNGVSLRYGKNITSIEQEESIASTITGICPYWADDEGNIVTVPEKVVQSSRADNFPFKRSVVIDFTQDFDEAPTVAQLRAAAQSYITSNNIGVPNVGMDISYENLADYEEYKDIAILEQVKLGDTVHVYFEPLDIEASARIVETRYNCLLEKYDRIRIGSVKTSLSSTINNSVEEAKQEIIKSGSVLERAFENAIKELTGADGGYVVIRRNEATGQPYEILIMDSPNINSAQSILRLNMNGLGLSKSGINGPYTTAITGQGIVANAITTGVLNAILIQAGVLQSQENGNDPKFYLDLDTGVLKGNFSELKISGDSGATQRYADTAASDAASDAVDDYDESLNQSVIFNKLTNNGQAQGIYLQNNKVYINGEYIKANTIGADAIVGNSITIGKLAPAAKAVLITGTVSCYYRSTTNSTPTIDANTSIGTATNTDNAWEYVMPRPKNGAYFYTCERYTKADGTVSFSAVRQMSNLTYTSLWCSANDQTAIDGAHIYAGSVTAAKIDTDDLFAQNLTASNFNIIGGSVHINTTNQTMDYIRLNHEKTSAYMASNMFVVENSEKAANPYLSGVLQGGGVFFSNRNIAKALATLTTTAGWGILDLYNTSDSEQGRLTSGSLRFIDGSGVQRTVYNPTGLTFYSDSGTGLSSYGPSSVYVRKANGDKIAGIAATSGGLGSLYLGVGNVNRVILNDGGLYFYDSSGDATGYLGPYFKILSGVGNSGQVNANSYKDYSITFSSSFAKTPNVFPVLDTEWTNDLPAHMNIVAHNITKTGFTARVFNGNSSNQWVPFKWIAISF